MKSNFSEAEHEQLKHYVYLLIDPRNGKVFYVGKGEGDRVFSHNGNTSSATDSLDDTEVTDHNDIKSNRQQIKDIENAKLSVIRVIHRHGMTNEEALHVEASLIDLLGDLNNKQIGHDSGAFGPRNVAEISALYGLPEFPDSSKINGEKLILINVNKIEDWSSEEAIYNQVRGNWRINTTRAENADYIIAVKRGVTLGVFQKDGDSWKWEESSEDGRRRFSGKSAEMTIWDKYVGENGMIIPKEFRHVRVPIRYINC